MQVQVENKVLRILGLKEEEETRWKKLCTKKLHNLYASPNTNVNWLHLA
jgi:hypothetical protein